MMNKSLLVLSIYIVLSQCLVTTLAQRTAQVPAPSGPINITQILEKGGQFTVLIRLFTTTHVGDQINTQLINSRVNQGITIFAPTDNAFNSLKAGTLNSLSSQNQVALTQFHLIPTFLSIAQFQTVSNPVRTQAGNSGPGQFPLNITTSGNQVNISTGVNEATVSNTIYTDNELAVYQVDHVLLPLAMFGTPAPTEAPRASPRVRRNTTEVADVPTSGDDNTTSTTDDTSEAMRGVLSSSIGVAAFFAALWL